MNIVQNPKPTIIDRSFVRSLPNRVMFNLQRHDSFYVYGN